jgi:hypothetical protein
MAATRDAMPLDTRLTRIGLPPSVFVPRGLARGLRSFPPPATLGEVIRIARAGRFGEISGIGEFRITRIERRLTAALTGDAADPVRLDDHGWSAPHV